MTDRPDPSGAAAARELVDVVDEHDRVVDVVPRARMRAERLMHRCVFIAVVHPDGRLLVHQRSPHKDIWPGWWDLAVGGVVGAGETYDEAAQRELAEEVGIEGVEPAVLDGGATQRYVDADVALLGRCYRVVHPGPFTFADGEVVQARFVDRDELDHLLAHQPFLPDSRALLLPLLG
jgi:isopentenyldiphosphate isomerase